MNGMTHQESKELDRSLRAGRFLRGICRDMPTFRYSKGREPFIFNGRMVATNGKMMALLTDYDASPTGLFCDYLNPPVKGTVPTIDSIVKQLDTCLASSITEPLQDIPPCVYEQEMCFECEYLGCDECGGKGVEYSPAESSTCLLGGVRIALDLLNRLRDRKKLSYVAFTLDGVPAVAFKFAGGTAVIMGMSIPS